MDKKTKLLGAETNSVQLFLSLSYHSTKKTPKFSIFYQKLKIMRFFTSFWLLFITSLAQSQSNPAISAWMINKTGKTGFAGIPTNVQQVQYSDKSVYISTNDIAGWIPIGYDWPNNPWFPTNQNFVFKITLNPKENTNNKINTPYGHIGIWTNGVSIYNPKDAKTWQDSGKWFQNAYYFEHTHLQTFDPCLGHPNNKNEYHLHVNPTCLYDDKDSLHHSPIIGYAFDGFPIYGAYSYSNTDGTGSIKRMTSSYRLRSISNRKTLPDGTVLSPTLQGPPLSAFPLGAYIEDYEYAQSLGTLDEWNGRFCVTPEYPKGIYAYFVTIDANQTPVYPFVLGPKFYGTTQMGNLGPNSGHNVINEPVQVFVSSNDVENEVLCQVFPNPANDLVHFFILPSYNVNMTATLFDAKGQKIRQQENIQTANTYTFSLENLPTGIYYLKINSKEKQQTVKVVKVE